MLKECDENDILMSDGIYKRRSKKIRHVKPHRNSTKNPLSSAKVAENDQLSETRGKIERKFGDQVSKFDIISKPFRHGEQRFNHEFKIGKIRNLHLDFKCVLF